MGQSGRIPRLPAALVAAACALGLTAVGLPAGAASPTGAGPSAPSSTAWTRGALDPGLPVVGGLQRVVVSGTAGAAALVEDAVRAVGGVLTAPLPIVEGAAATVPAERLAELAGLPGVRAVTADRQVDLSGLSYDESLSASSYAWTSGATSTWAAGSRGASVGVAVLDTGVSPVGDLAGRLVHGPDLSGEGNHTRDSHGHGTVMAGIVAGSGTDAGATPRTGTAPAAHVVSVKVAGANGATDVSTVLAGMHWVGAFAADYGIRVLNLSWGVPSTQSPTVDPLNHAVERLWRSGITVVVAAGNSGPGPMTVTKPGDDPLVITVGAYDDRGDRTLENDVVPKWSSQGPTAHGLAKPDLVAPGRTLVATRAPGSTVELENPKALVAPSYIKGSGTSEAAAVVSGAAALLLSARPSLTPDQVKAALVTTAQPIPAVAATAQGAGRLAVDRALAADVTAAPLQVPVALGTGTLEGSRGSMSRVQVTCAGLPKVLNDETTSWCTAYDPRDYAGGTSVDGVWTAGSWTAGSWTAGSWTADAWKAGSWTGGAWNAGSWTAGSWTGDKWASDAWKAGSWTAGSWTAGSWTAGSWTAGSWTAGSWTAGSWTAGSWTAGSWTAGSWTGMGFTAGSWTAGSWTSATYEDEDLFLSAFWGGRPHWTQRIAGEQSDPAPIGRTGLR